MRSTFQGQIGKSNEYRNCVRKIKLDDLRVTLQNTIKVNYVEREMTNFQVKALAELNVLDGLKADRIVSKILTSFIQVNENE